MADMADFWSFDKTLDKYLRTCKAERPMYAHTLAPLSASFTGTYYLRSRCTSSWRQAISLAY